MHSCNSDLEAETATTSFSEFTGDDITSIQITDNEGDTLTLLKEDSGWTLNTPVSGETDPEQIEALLDGLTGLTVRDVYPADEVSGLFKGYADLGYQLTFTDDSEKTMELAKKDAAYFLKMSDSDLYFKVESWQVEKINEFDVAKLTTTESETTETDTPKLQE